MSFASIAHANMAAKRLLAIAGAGVFLTLLLRAMSSMPAALQWGSAILVAGPLWVLSDKLSGAFFASCLPPEQLFLPSRIERRPVDEPIWICVPVIIRRVSDIDAACECVWENARLNSSSMLWFIILFDLPDAAAKHVANDSFLRSYVDSRVADLNLRLQQRNLAACRFLFRERRYDPVDHLWLGWERKRGKLVEFMRLVRGHSDTSFGSSHDDLHQARFLITIDVDSRLENDGAAGLWNAFMIARTRDPRLTICAPSLDTPALPQESLFRRLYEPYFLADGWVGPEPSDRQVLSGNDLFYGKGLIAIDGFLGLCEKGIPPNTVLSHDHLEGLLARTQSFHDVRLFEPFPSTRFAWEERQHRWVRGDFQLVPWICRGGPPDAPVRLKLEGRTGLSSILLNDLDPLARWGLTLIVAAKFALSGLVGWMLLAVACPSVVILPLVLFRLFHRRQRTPLNLTHEVLDTIGRAIAKTLGTAIYLQRDAFIALDAAVISLVRLYRGRRNMLEWHPKRRARLFVRIRAYECLTLLVSLASDERLTWLIAWYIVGPFAANWIVVRHKSIELSTSPEQSPSLERKAA